MTFPDAPLDPRDPDVCPRCGGTMDDLEDEERATHVKWCDRLNAKAEIQAESEREERRG